MIRVGICPVPFNAAYSELREVALAAEEAGFESVWTWDHLISFNSDTEPVLECWSTLAALAEATCRVKLGSFVTNVMSRHPDVLAKALATIQDVSGGRVELGIGAGERSREQLAYNRPFPGGRERVERVGEAVEVMKLLWSGELVYYRGQYYKMEGARLCPAPSPVPPVMVAGLGPRSTRNAARVGDGWTCDSPRDWGRDSDDKFFRLRPIVLEELERLGRPRESFEVSVSDLPHEEVINDPLAYVSRLEEQGIDRVIFDFYAPYDMSAISAMGKALYG